MKDDQTIKKRREAESKRMAGITKRRLEAGETRQLVWLGKDASSALKTLLEARPGMKRDMIIEEAIFNLCARDKPKSEKE